MLTKKSNLPYKQRGLSLVEMMVALAIGMVIISGALYISTSATTASRDNIRMSFLNQELSNAMNLITKDLRRASYWGGAMDAARVSGVSSLTFSAVSGNGVSITINFDTADVSNAIVDGLGAKADDVGAKLVYLEKSAASPYPVQRYEATITDYTASTNTFTANLSGTFPSTVLANGGVVEGSWAIIPPTNTVTTVVTGDDCAIFSYDVNGNGLVPTDENFGFRFDSTEQAVELRTGGTSCSGTGWENITDPTRVQIYEFTIVPTATSVSAGQFSVDVREYEIILKGRLTSDTSIDRTLRETVRVRNDGVS